MKRISAAAGFALLTLSTTNAQTPVYTDYIGAGHFEGIHVTTSSNLTQNGWNRQAEGMRTLDGGGLQARHMEASRFLAQAAFGGSPAEIDQLAASLDFEGWIDWQTEIPASNMLQLTTDAWSSARQIAQSQGQNPNSIDFHYKHFQGALWQAAKTRSDVLRQRVALALSEILVVSTVSVVGFRGEAYAHYHDVLMKHAFGNYRDLLVEVSLHPTMGVYLTHFRNAKANPDLNTFPDENYAREIMQLLTIGLHELNNDGSLKLDIEGNPIPTYSMDDIRELAKAFTGLGAAAINEVGVATGRSVDWTVRRGVLGYTTPMKMYPEHHATGPKYVLGHTINEGEGIKDIEKAVDILIDHPNTGPFVARKLIQQLVTSNPSPAYINDVANAFNDDGTGVKGNMLEVLKAILLHDEARSCEAQMAASHGKMRAPSFRYLHVTTSLDFNTFQGLYWPSHYQYLLATNHFPYSSPSVFNFFLPDFQPNGPVADVGLVAPEFEIHNTSTALGYINEIDNWSRNNLIFRSENLPATGAINYGTYGNMHSDPDVILNFLDVQFTHGRLSESTRNRIRTAMNSYNPANPLDLAKERFDLALYLVLVSPDYTILK